MPMKKNPEICMGGPDQNTIYKFVRFLEDKNHYNFYNHYIRMCSNFDYKTKIIHDTYLYTI